MGKKSSAEWGSQTAPTQVVGYVPDSDCQEASIAYLVDTAEKNPSALHLRLVRMFTTEGQKITLSEHGKICSAYLINGSSTVTVTRADGTVKQATFRSGPGDLWTNDDLKLAVEQAMAKQAAK